MVTQLLSLFILMLRFIQIWPVGAKRKKCFLRDSAGKKVWQERWDSTPLTGWGEQEEIVGRAQEDAFRQRWDNLSTELMEKKDDRWVAAVFKKLRSL